MNGIYILMGVVHLRYLKGTSAFERHLVELEQLSPLSTWVFEHMKVLEALEGAWALWDLDT